jgi:hypothetical protein
VIDQNAVTTGFEVREECTEAKEKKNFVMVEAATYMPAS